MTAPAPAAAPARRRPLRVATVQYDPKLGAVASNAARVLALTAPLEPGSIDLLVLPEMALTGYVFRTPAAVAPFLERPGAGPTARLCAELARRLRCHVVAGYPEALPEDAGSNAPGVGFNSAVVVAPDGAVAAGYRKTFLFETDRAWARPGHGFAHVDLDGVGRVALGICMDMNPEDFAAPWDAFELATYAARVRADVLVVPMNWLDPAEDAHDSDSEPDADERAAFLAAPSVSNLNYWAARLTPLLRPPEGGEPPKDVVFVAANRCGTEDGTTFVGSSAVMRVSANPPLVQLAGYCSRGEERVLVCSVD